jgi:hypothetical protein
MKNTSMKIIHLLLTASIITTAIVVSGCGGVGADEDSSSTAGNTNGSSSGSSSLASCESAGYPGDKSDPQVYSFDAIAQFDACAYKATGDSRYKTDGDNQCKVLAGLISATNSSFRPLYCSGSSLKV